MTYDPAEQKRRRTRARVSQTQLANLLGMSEGALSQYENGKKPLPHALDPEDYELALAKAIVEKAAK